MEMMAKLAIINFYVLTSIFVVDVSAHQDDQNLDPLVACEDKTHDDYCEFYNHDGDKYLGICKDVLEQFTCVRNQPIQYATKNIESESGHSHDDSVEKTIDHDKGQHAH